MTGPDSLALSDALGRLATTPRLLVALDFDGTLAPEVDAPLQARALPAAMDAITRLSALDRTTVALVSGRDLASLIEVSQMPDEVLLVGSHGIEVRVDGHETSLSDDEQAARGRLSDAVHGAAQGREGVFVEEKPAGLALHTRLADDATTAAVHVAAREAVGALGDVHERVGKNVLEFAVRATGKNDGIDRLRESVDATGVLFAGDDVTDEDGFRALGEGDLSIKVGQGETGAMHRVADPAAMADLLVELAGLREHLGYA
ncbi:trehalose-phosphatase [Frigoribacterium sp. PhB24]|uniref:trehalose-phosphatase n=1 Tax=Frigoribacterium sp. PhB24 TaxID=2485204 RepID=UPI000F9D933D|nr:trehalose-phosphatase [Frigoribacterium sp. PhB24]ROS54846.1 trehalose 6-phosphatase [Frigoribacterium sp. PhB24]